MIRLLRSVAIGVAAAAVLLTVLRFDAPLWLLGVSLTVAILTGVLVAIVGSFGASAAVAQADTDRPEVGLLDPVPAHWQQQVAQDTRVRALTSAPAWELPPKPGRDKRGFLRIPGVVLVLVAVLAFGATLWPHRESLVDLATGTPLDEVREQADRRADAAASIYPADRTPGVVDDLVAAAGTTQVTGVHVYQTYAYLDALTSADASTTDEYTWRDGTVEHDGATSIQPDPADLPRMLFDATAIDWTLVATLTGRIADQSGIDDPTPIVAVSRPVTGFSDGDGVWAYGDVQIVVSVSDDYRSASVAYDTSGQVTEMSGGAPGSAAAEWATANG